MYGTSPDLETQFLPKQGKRSSGIVKALAVSAVVLSACLAYAAFGAASTGT